MIQDRPVRDVLFHEDQGTNSLRDGRKNMVIKGFFRNCFMDVFNMSQT
jgi:hypothetical protein